METPHNNIFTRETATNIHHVYVSLQPNLANRAIGEPQSSVVTGDHLKVI